MTQTLPYPRRRVSIERHRKRCNPNEVRRVFEPAGLSGSLEVDVGLRQRQAPRATWRRVAATSLITLSRVSRASLAMRGTDRRSMEGRRDWLRAFSGFSQEFYFDSGEFLFLFSELFALLRDFPLKRQNFI